MPLIFTKSEIKEQLLELGFNSVTDEQLSGFVKDLKKLIKKEEKKRRERKRKELEGHPLEAATLPGTSASASLYSTTDTERASSASITNSTPPGRPAGTRIGTGTDEVDVITLTPPNRHPPQPVPEPRRVGPKKTPPKKPEDNQVLRERTNNATTKERPKERVKPDVPVPTRRVASLPVPSGGQINANTNINYSISMPPSSSASSEIESDLSCSSTDSERPRVRLPPKSVRHDPVSLYHFYKSIWDKQRGPGENPRMQLRWNVRAGTLGRVPCDPDGAPTKYLRPRC